MRKGSDVCNPNLTAETVKFLVLLMVWGVFGYGGLRTLLSYSKVRLLTLKCPRSTLMTKLANCFAQTGKARKVKEWVLKCEIDIIHDWPPNSPDISPVENF